MFGKQCFMLEVMNTINPEALAAIREAVEAAKGPSNLARVVGVSPQMVTQWTSDDPKRHRPVAAPHCPAIEKNFGVSRKRLRPNDWHKYWPDLDEQPAAA